MQCLNSLAAFRMQSKEGLRTQVLPSKGRSPSYNSQLSKPPLVSTSSSLCEEPSQILKSIQSDYDHQVHHLEARNQHLRELFEEVTENIQTLHSQTSNLPYSSEAFQQSNEKSHFEPPTYPPSRSEETRKTYHSLSQEFCALNNSFITIQNENALLKETLEQETETKRQLAENLHVCNETLSQALAKKDLLEKAFRRCNDKQRQTAEELKRSAKRLVDLHAQNTRQAKSNWNLIHQLARSKKVASQAENLEKQLHQLQQFIENKRIQQLQRLLPKRDITTGVGPCLDSGTSSEDISNTRSEKLESKKQSLPFVSSVDKKVMHHQSEAANPSPFAAESVDSPSNQPSSPTIIASRTQSQTLEPKASSSSSSSSDTFCNSNTPGRYSNADTAVQDRQMNPDLSKGEASRGHNRFTESHQQLQQTLFNLSKENSALKQMNQDLKDQRDSLSQQLKLIKQRMAQTEQLLETKSKRAEEQDKSLGCEKLEKQHLKNLYLHVNKKHKRLLNHCAKVEERLFRLQKAMYQPTQMRKYFESKQSKKENTHYLHSDKLLSPSLESLEIDGKPHLPSKATSHYSQKGSLTFTVTASDADLSGKDKSLGLTIDANEPDTEAVPPKAHSERFNTDIKKNNSSCISTNEWFPFRSKRPNLQTLSDNHSLDRPFSFHSVQQRNN